MASDECIRCGRTGHFVTNCYAKTSFDGKLLSRSQGIIPPTVELTAAEPTPEPTAAEPAPEPTGIAKDISDIVSAAENIVSAVENIATGSIGSYIKSWF
jgi:hypothetical protein